MRREVKNADQFSHAATPRSHTHTQNEGKKRKGKPIDGTTRREGGDWAAKAPGLDLKPAGATSLVRGGRIWAGRILGQWFASFRLETGVGRE